MLSASAHSCNLRQKYIRAKKTKLGPNKNLATSPEASLPFVSQPEAASSSLSPDGQGLDILFDIPQKVFHLIKNCDESMNADILKFSLKSFHF